MTTHASPGVGGSYRYDPETDRLILIDYTADPSAPDHPLAEPPAPPKPAPVPRAAAPIKTDEPSNPKAA